MAPKPKSKKYEGFEEFNSKADFIKFENPGDEFHGIFLEARESQSKKFGNTQIIWTCTDLETGELVRISEKTTMSDFRLSLKTGDEIRIVYNGDVETTGGRKPYKDFTLYKKK